MDSCLTKVFTEILDLSGNNMTGSIPSTIESMGLLSKLQPIIGKGLLVVQHGALDESHTLLSNYYRPAEQIDLSLNKLFGIVPSELGSMSNLRKCR